MATPTQVHYQRLPGSGYRQIAPGWAILLLFFVIGIFALLLRGRHVRLYLAEDHLLAVDWDGATEHYKRFRYEDIQALVIRRTSEGRLLSVFTGFLTVILYLLAVGSADSPVGMWVFLGLGTMFLLVLVGNLIGGPTCKCHLRTAVQTEELVSLGRLKRAEPALSLVRERIVAVQGNLTPAEVADRYQQLREYMSKGYVVDDPAAPPRMI
jgi:hypothetical protein